MNTIEINIDVNKHPLLNQLSEEKVRIAVDKILEALSMDNNEISLYFCDNEKMKELNRTYRGKDYPTDVLSFESGEDVFMGDIAISVERASEQMEDFESPSLDYETLRLIIHGILHLCGYDHENGEEDARLMSEKENELMLEVEKSTLYQK
jgi:probable rRNA maturation factor